MWSTVNNYGLLNRFQQLYAINPYGFNQVDHPSIDYLPKVWSQYDRELVSGLINKELLAFNRMLGFNVMPTETTQEMIITDEAMLYSDITIDGSYLSEMGVITRTRLGSASVTYSGDTATFNITMSQLTGSDYLEVYLQDSTNQGYRLFDIKSEYDGTKYVLTTNKWLLVKPELHPLYDSVEPTIVPNVSDSYVTTLYVYKGSYTTTTPITVHSYDDSTNYTTTCDVVVVNARQGVFRIRKPYSFTGIPYKMVINHISGFPYSSGKQVATLFENLLLRRVRAGLPESYYQQATTTSTRYNKDLEMVDNVRLIDMEVQRMVDTYKDMVQGSRFYG